MPKQQEQQQHQQQQQQKEIIKNQDGEKKRSSRIVVVGNVRRPADKDLPCYSIDNAWIDELADESFLEIEYSEIDWKQYEQVLVTLDKTRTPIPKGRPTIINEFLSHIRTMSKLPIANVIIVDQSTGKEFVFDSDK